MSSIRPDPNLLKKYPNAITQEDIELRRRYGAMLSGLALGDALGQAADYLTAQDVEERWPLGLREVLGGGPFERTRGQPGTPTQLALLVTESLCSGGARLDLDDVCHRLIEWLESKPSDVSPVTRSAIENLRAGDPPEQSGAVAYEDFGREQASDNSALALCLPLALTSLQPGDRLSELTSRLCRATHASPRVVGSAVALVTALGGLIRGEDDFIERAALAGAVYSDEVRAVIERSQARPPAALRIDGPERSKALTTLEVAFSALTFAGSFEDGLSEVVSRGGDADVNGAVAGALLGARFGRPAHPERWVKATHAAGRLNDLSDRLYKTLGGK